MRGLLPLLGLGLAAGLGIARGDDRSEPPPPKLVAPFVSTPPKVVAKMLEAAGVKAGDTVWDLGCGDGRIAIAAVKDFGAKRGVGIDFYPARLKACEKSVADARLTDAQKKALSFRQGDVLKLTADDFRDVDVVTLYLLPALNRELRPVLQAGLKKGARVVSHDFDMGRGAWEPDKTIQVEADRTHTVYLWTVR